MLADHPSGLEIKRELCDVYLHADFVFIEISYLSECERI